MAIRAQKHTLPCLGAQRIDRQRDALSAEVQSLLKRVEMVELKRTGVAVIAADAAATAGILDENRLHLSTSPRDCLCTTASAAVVAAAFENEIGRTVPGARHREGDQPRAFSSLRQRRGPPAGLVLRPQSVPPEPMPDRGSAHSHLRGDLSDRGTRRD